MNKFSKIRLTAFLCAFIFTFSLIISGCTSVSDVVKNAGKKADGLIHIDGEDTDSTDASQIVVGSDGKSYLVDSNGNSVVYDATSAYIVDDSKATTAPSVPGRTTTTTRKTNSNNSGTPTTNKTVATTTTTKAPETTDEVYNAVAAQRKLGFNKGYDTFAGLANFYLDTVRSYFEYDNRYWLIEFWKGEYALAAVGCEIGIYVAEKSTVNDLLYKNGGPEALHYDSAEDADTLYMSMNLYQYQSAEATTPKHCFTFNRKRCWWAAQFSTGNLYRHSDRTSLVMIGTVEFTSTTMMNLLLDQLESKGFKEGSTSSYKNVERYSVDGKKVTFVWKNFKES